MANRHSFHPIPLRQDLEALYLSGLTQEEVGQQYNVSQKVIYGWFRKLGIQARKAAKRNQFGSNNHMWRGEDAGYASLHRRVEVRRGKPRLCSMCGTMEAKMYNWANLTGNYADIFDYIRVCRSCHAKLDNHARFLPHKTKDS